MSSLKITFENAKLKGIWHYSLPSGYTCPGAKCCKTFFTWTSAIAVHQEFHFKPVQKLNNDTTEGVQWLVMEDDNIMSLDFITLLTYRGTKVHVNAKFFIIWMAYT